VDGDMEDSLGVVVDNDMDMDIVDAPSYKCGSSNECQRAMMGVDFLFGTNCSSKSKYIHVYRILRSRKTVRATLLRDVEPCLRIFPCDSALAKRSPPIKINEINVNGVALDFCDVALRKFEYR
jgi:hypothetical protein